MSILRNIKIFFALVPLWWILGIDQWVWPFLVLFLWSKFFLIKKKIILTPASKFSLWFLFVILLSGFFVEESYRFFTFVKNFATYSSCILLLIILTNVVKQKDKILNLFKIITIITTIFSLISLICILKTIDYSFKALFSPFIPFKEFTYVKTMLNKSFLQKSYFFTEIYRIKGFCMYPTQFAVILGMLSFFSFYFFQRTRNYLWLIASAINILSLFLTFSRTPIAGFLIGLFYLFSFSSLFNIRKRIILFFLTISIFGGLFYVSLKREIIFDLLARGLESRKVLYQVTLDSWKERPLLGWGTCRHLEESSYPVGSHSHYLAVLYQQGIIGCAVYLLILLSLFKSLIKIKKQGEKFGDYLMASFILILISSITECMDLDTINFHIIWLVFSLIEITKKELYYGKQIK